MLRNIGPNDVNGLHARERDCRMCPDARLQSCAYGPVAEGRS